MCCDSANRVQLHRYWLSVGIFRLRIGKAADSSRGFNGLFSAEDHGPRKSETLDFPVSDFEKIETERCGSAKIVTIVSAALFATMSIQLWRS